jgi:hypothetical protein
MGQNHIKFPFELHDADITSVTVGVFQGLSSKLKKEVKIAMEMHPY